MLSSLENGLTGFTQQTIRDRSDTTVTVDGTIVSDSFNLSADQGSIVVAGTINASNVAATDPNGNSILVGGAIDLEAGGSLTLNSTAILNASGQNFNNAGQGGTVTLAAGSYQGLPTSTSSASINLMSGSEIELGIGSSSGGTLNLRAPQVSGGSFVGNSNYTPVAVNANGGGSPTDVAIDSIPVGVVQNASSIVVQGVYVQDAMAATALIDNYETAALTNASAFMGNAATIQSRIFGSNIANVEIEPGEEIDNSLGSLELQNTWDLSSVPLSGWDAFSAGLLIIRAAGNINIDFGASLTDGFTSSGGVSYLNQLLPSAASHGPIILLPGPISAPPLRTVETSASYKQTGLGGSFQVGYQNTSSPIYLPDTGTNNPATFFQTIRTGTGNITIDAGGNILLLNNLATIYTGGHPSRSDRGRRFHSSFRIQSPTRTSLPATYSSGGGNVTISAQGDIARETYDSNGTSMALVPDSSANCRATGSTAKAPPVAPPPPGGLISPTFLRASAPWAREMSPLLLGAASSMSMPPFQPTPVWSTAN